MRHARQSDTIGFARRELHPGYQDFSFPGLGQRVPRRERVSEGHSTITSQSQGGHQLIDKFRLVVNHHNTCRHGSAFFWAVARP